MLEPLRSTKKIENRDSKESLSPESDIACSDSKPSQKTCLYCGSIASKNNTLYSVLQLHIDISQIKWLDYWKSDLNNRDSTTFLLRNVEM